MAYKNTVYTGRTVVLPRDLLKSRAYQSLTTGAAHIVLMGFMLLRQMEKKEDAKKSSWWEVVNDNALVFTYADAEKIGISNNRFTAAIEMLLERGFIHIVKTGHGIRQNATFYGLSDGWMKWKPGDDPLTTRRKRNASDSPGCFQPGNQRWKNRKKATDVFTGRSTDKKTGRAESASKPSRKNTGTSL